MVVDRPVAQTVHDHLPHDRMVAVQGVPAAAEIIIMPVGGQHVVDIVIEALEGKAGPHLVPLCRMVKDHVQDALDAVIIELLDQVLQLFALLVILRSARIAGIGGKEADRVIAPVVHHLGAVHHAAVLHLVKFKDRHQFHRVDPQLLQIGDLLPQPFKGARIVHAGGSMPRKAPHMELVDHQVLHGDRRRPVPSPVKVILHHPGLVK